MEKNIRISYDEIEDIAYLGMKDKVKFSLDIALPSGDVVVDIGFDGLVKGIEIFNASEFFSLLKEQMIKVKSAGFRVNYTPSYMVMSLSLDSKDGVIKNNIVVPYSKKMLLAK